MDKLLVNQWNDVICFDQEHNALKNAPNDIDIRSIYLAEKDGQVITQNEVVDYKAGDIILVLSKWYKDHNKQKIIVVTDAVAKDDITRWWNEINKEDEAS